MTKLIFLNEGESTEVQGSGKKPYLVRKIGGVVDCSCPSWKNLGGPISNRVCKHIRARIDPDCLLPEAQAAMGIGTPVPASSEAPRLTKTGKVSTAVKAIVIKDTAPPCLLAHKWEGEDPTGWWMSEKLDGCRAVWDGQKFISRLGNEFHAPESFKETMPKGVVLDGELYSGRQEFQRTVSIIRKLIPDEAEWSEIKFHVFDIIDFTKTFEERQKMLDELWDGEYDETSWEIEPQALCGGLDDLKAFLKDIEKNGGEGLMLRKPGSLYEVGRSNTLLKVKSFQDDEAFVVGYSPGRGKHKNRLGALVCEWNGVTFEIGTGLSDKQRENPPKIGTKIIFRYFEKTLAGVPRFPVFITARDYE